MDRDYLTRLPDELMCGVVQYLSVNTLGRLARASQFFYSFTTPILYEKDARDEHPRAIFWAASFCTTSMTEKIILKVLDLAILYGGDVNQMYPQGRDAAAPLHLATARGNIEVVRKLLEHQADPNALGRDFFPHSLFSLDERELESRIQNSEISVASRHSKWRPLFVPFVIQDEEMIQLLLQYGASPVVTVPFEDERSASNSGTINILHILASHQRRKYIDATNLSYFEKYSHLINVPILPGGTPLFFSLGRGNDAVLEEIIANGGNIEDVNGLGRTPLMQAITYYCKGHTPEIRKWYKDIIEYLIKSCNAKVGKHHDARVMETPLTCVIKAIPTTFPADWKLPIRDIRGIIDLLLAHGADLNEISNEGLTLLNTICRLICIRQDTGALLNLFSSLVEDGADLSILFPSGKSMLGACIVNYNHQPTKFYNLLLKLGASLVPQEVDAVFKEWAQCPGLRKSFDMLRYSKHVSQVAIDFAYEIAFRKDVKLFDSLQSHFPKTTIAERIASEALLNDNAKQFDLALEIDDFNGDYIHSNGNSLLHLIVDRLEKYPKYKDAQARDDANELLQQGAPLEHKDDCGKTPLQKLWDLREKRNCPILRLYLHDVKASWEDYKNGHTQEGVDKDVWSEKWKEILEDALI